MILPVANCDFIQDLEAQHSIPLVPLSESSRRRSDLPVMTGRGGAGNAIPASALDTANPASDASSRTAAAATAAAPSTLKSSGTKVVKTVMRYKMAFGQKSSSGRGGAGNIYQARLMEEQRQKAAEAKAKETQKKVREEARRDVEQDLAPPQKAFLGPR